MIKNFKTSTSGILILTALFGVYPYNANAQVQLPLKQTNATSVQDTLRSLPKSSEIRLHSGEVKVLDGYDITRVAVGNGEIVSATVLESSKLLVIGQKVGDTNVLLWSKNGLQQEIRIRVTASDVVRVEKEVKEILSDIKGISIKIVGERIYIEGDKLSEFEKKRIADISKQYSNIIDNTLLASVPSPSVAPSLMVMFDVYFVEFKNNYFQELGINWQKSVSGMNIGVFGEGTRGNLNLRPGEVGNLGITLPNGRQYGISSAMNISFALPGIINLAVNTGNASLLAAPKLAVRSGGSAKFLAGGEFPIAVSGITGNSVQFKQYGILLDVQPTVHSDNTVSGLIMTEVSAIDRAMAINGLPGLLKRRTETDFFTQMGEAIVLSGLYTQENSKSTDKVPLLGDIPLLKGLFNSSAESRNNSELVVFIVPKEHSSKDTMNKEVISKTQEMTENQNIENAKYQVLPKLKFESRIFNGEESGYTKGMELPDRSQNFNPFDPLGNGAR